MAEQIPLKPEHEKSHENKQSKAEQREKLKDSIEAGKQAKHEAKDSLEAIRSSIDKEADKTADVKRQEQEAATADDKGPATVIIDRNVKKKAYKKEIHRIQTHLPKAQRSFSKFIHAPTIEAVSEVSSKTVARPSGLLGGGIAAFGGTTILVLISRHYGFTYNFFVFIALLVIGFIVGLIAEMIVRGVLKARS